MIYFQVDRAMSSVKNEYMVWFKEAAKKFYPFKGSLMVIYSRIMGLSYPEYLRYVRDVHGARISGKNQLYPSVLFPTKEAAEQFAKILDTRFSQIQKIINK